MIENSVMVELNDIFSAEDGSLYEILLLDHHLLHSQHVLDYIENPERQHETLRFNLKISFGVFLWNLSVNILKSSYPKERKCVSFMLNDHSAVSSFHASNNKV
jgi:hypothetical protein